MGRYCGFSFMDNNIFNGLLRLEDSDNESHVKNIKSKSIMSSKSRVASCIANLYHQDGMIDFEQMVASILVFGWNQVVKYHKEKLQDEVRISKTRTDNWKILNLTLNLAKHSHLEKLWKQMNGQWIV